MELKSETDQLNQLKTKLSSYSKNLHRNKHLSESVDLDQSRLEGFLNAEVEAKQELMSVLHKRRRTMNNSRISLKNGDVSQKFISNREFINSSQNELDSEKSFN